MGGGVERGDGYHIGAGEKVPVAPNPKRRSKDGNPLTSVEGEVSVVVGIGSEWLLCCCLDTSKGRASIGVDPVVDLVVWGPVPLGGPSAGGGASEVPNAALCDAVGNGEEGVVDSGSRFRR